ncbi:MAG: periplasmic heavy metal sensor [Candidatus Acidiferrum sp.]
MKATALSACLLAVFAFVAVLPARAQQPDQDPVGQSFFAPELVMQHQEALGLSEEQRSYLKSEIRQAQLKFTESQFKLQDEMEKLLSLVKQPHVEEKDALAQLEKVLALEREIKRLQVTLLVHIKNDLTPEQQAKLAEIRGKTAGK